MKKMYYPSNSMTVRPFHTLDVKVACRILDVSGSGALIACSKAVFREGDRLHVTNAKIILEEEPFSFFCTVMRIKKARFNNIYGCRFEGLSVREQDRLARAVFRLQQLERKSTQDDEL